MCILIGTKILHATQGKALCHHMPNYNLGTHSYEIIGNAVFLTYPFPSFFAEHNNILTLDSVFVKNFRKTAFSKGGRVHIPLSHLSICFFLEMLFVARLSACTQDSVPLGNRMGRMHSVGYT